VAAPSQQILTWFEAGAVFVLVASAGFMTLIAAMARQNRRSKILERRLRTEAKAYLDGAHPSPAGQRASNRDPLQSRHPERHPLMRLRIACENAGWNISPLFLLLLTAALALAAGFFVYAMTGRAVWAAAAAAVVVVCPVIALRRGARNKETLFDAQFADALGLAARSLRVGLPLLASFRAIADELDPPVSTLFSDILQQQALGVPLDEAILAMAVQTHSDDVKIFAASMSIQTKSGGNLADMMDQLAAVIHDRQRVHRRARILTAQTQLSKRVLIGIPFAILLIVHLIKPDYMMPMYTTSIGNLLLAVGAICLLLGVWIMNRIATLKY